MAFDPHQVENALVAAEAGGRVRLAHAENNDEATLKSFANGQVAADAHVVTDGLASYNERSLSARSHDMVVQTKAERQENDTLQACHWAISLLKRWLLGTHAGRCATSTCRPTSTSSPSAITAPRRTAWAGSPPG